MPRHLAQVVASLLAVIAPIGSSGPFSPCGAPRAGTHPAIVEGYTGGSPFDSTSVVATIGAVALLLAVVACVALARRRSGHSNRRLLWLGGASVVFAGLCVAWIWQLRNSYLGGCAVTFNATPLSEQQARSLAPQFALLIAALAVAWLVTLAWVARRRA